MAYGRKAPTFRDASLQFAPVLQNKTRRTGDRSCPILSSRATFSDIGKNLPLDRVLYTGKEAIVD